MKRIPFVLACVAVLASGGVAASAPPPQQQVVTASDYDRAVRRLPELLDRYVLNAAVKPHWIGTTDQFWYRRALGEDRFEFVKVTARTGARVPAFDHKKVAAGLARALASDVHPNQLPFENFRYAPGGAVEFVAGEKLWTCSTKHASCESAAAVMPDPMSVQSPDGRWVAYVKDHDLWVRSAGSGEEFALTTDGERHYAYAGISGNTLESVEGGRPPVMLWSPDSKRLLTHRMDERKVREAALVQSVTPENDGRMKLHTWRYSTAGDEHLQTVEQWVFDVEARSGRKIALPALDIAYMTPIEAGESWWSPDGQRLFLLTRTRYMKRLSLHSADPRTGQVRELVTESADTFIEPGPLGATPMVHVLKNGDVLWFSERDGYGHLYVHDGATGKVKRRVTQGEWSVAGITLIDEAQGEIIVRAMGREPGDPYFERFYRVRLDGAAPNSGLTLLTPEDANHEVASSRDYSAALIALYASPFAKPSFSFSPSGRYFLDTYSRVDSPPVTVLRRRDGKLVAEVERADISALRADGITMPERFEALAADGKTPIYGTILRPANFDPSKRYPVLDSIYGGPQVSRAEPGFMGGIGDGFAAQSFAELGFIVVLIDGRGTPGRSKAFQDESYRRLNSAGGLDDHIAAMKQLAARYPSMDLDRVGIFGLSGGGYSTARALFAYPDFFKVGVSAAGNHDQRGYLADWGEYYLGPDDGKLYEQNANAPLARHMKGKLLLIHGDMDPNVHPWLTMQVVDQLIKHNKDFEMLIVPNALHGVLEGYAMRRSWDYLVRNLMGAEPPRDYLMPQAETPAADGESTAE